MFINGGVLRSPVEAKEVPVGIMMNSPSAGIFSIGSLRHFHCRRRRDSHWDIRFPGAANLYSRFLIQSDDDSILDLCVHHRVEAVPCSASVAIIVEG